MIEYLINQIIITVGQWQKFVGVVYEKRFEQLMKRLQDELQLDWDDAVRFIHEVIERGRAA